MYLFLLIKQEVSIYTIQHLGDTASFLNILIFMEISNSNLKGEQWWTEQLAD